MDKALPPGPAEPAPFPPASQTFADERVDLAQYWHVLRKRKGAILATWLAVVATVVVASFLMRPVYRSAATIQIERENPNILSFQEILSVDSRQDDFYQTQYMLLQSRSLVRNVIEQMRLHEHPEFARELAAFRDSGVAPKDGGWDPRLIDLVQKRITVLPVRRSRLVKIAVDSRDAQLSAALANNVVQSFIDMNVQTKFEATEAATQFLSTQIETLKKEIEDDKKTLQEYADKSDLSLDDRQNITVQRLADVNAALSKAQADRIEAESRYQALVASAGLKSIPAGGISSDTPPPEAADFGRFPEVASNQLIQSLRASLDMKSTKYREMSERFKEGWPEMERLRQEMAEVSRQIHIEEWQIVVGLLQRSGAEYKATRERERLLGVQLEEQKGSVSTMNRSAILYNTLKAEVDNKTSLLDSLLKRKNETDVSARLKGLKSSNVRVVDQAEVPLRPYRPDKRLNLLVALAVGLVLGVAMAALLEYLDNTIKSEDDVERVTGLPSLAVIPLFSSVGPGSGTRQIGDGTAAAGGREAPTQALVSFRDARSAVSEAYRTLRTSILLSAAGGPPRFLLVTSAQKSEGKTTTVINTAIALAQAGKNVLLIDADLRKPSCHRLLGLHNKTGLTTFLTANASLRSLVQLTPLPNLCVLTSGPIAPDPSELLGSARVKELMRAIPDAVDHVLIDSPPVLSVTDATLLAALVDGVVLVVRAGVSPRELVRRTQKQLRDVNAKIFGVVLNSVDFRAAEYYSSYTYHSYGEEEAS